MRSWSVCASEPAIARIFVRPEAWLAPSKALSIATAMTATSTAATIVSIRKEPRSSERRPCARRARHRATRSIPCWFTTSADRPLAVSAAALACVVGQMD
jgi:hypothetical protein